MGNILTAIQNIVENMTKPVDSSDTAGIHNRANQMGEALESYIKDAFADCLDKDKEEAAEARNKTFSYLGNSNNPPDAILRGSDAVEIKKIESISTTKLQLNSSYPKNKLYCDNPKLSKKSVECEEWTEKDMLYVIGNVKDKQLKNIFFIYGDLYCDDKGVYENLQDRITATLESLSSVDFAETNELGRFNKVDHLGITDLRIRGMWLIQSPFVLFKHLINTAKDIKFQLIALIPEDKYAEFENRDEFEQFCISKSVEISVKRIENPQNPAELINSKLITYSVK